MVPATIPDGKLLAMTTMVRQTAWLDHAGCSDMDPDMFDLLTAPPADRDGLAESLCDGCPVMVDCARDALRELPVSIVRAGVWCPQYSGPGVAAARARARALLVKRAGMEDS